MNKWIKSALVIGASLVATRQAIKFAKKNEYVKNLFSNLKELADFGELKYLLLDAIETVSEHTQEATEDVHVDANESIAMSVKSVLDSDIAKSLINDQEDLNTIKNLVDEAAKVEQLVRDWLK